jgi:ketosteroid isomerase-like protein
MSEESTTPDLVERTRRAYECADRADYDALMSFFGAHATWDMSPMGLGSYEEAVSIRRFFEDWRGSYEEYETEAEDVLELGDGVTLALLVQRGRLRGSQGHVEIRYAAVFQWLGGLVARITNYSDIDEARAAAERLAESSA